MKSLRICLLILASGISNLIAQTNGIDQTLNFIAPPTGGKFVSWHAKTGRSYFLQVSDPTAHLHKWNWSTVIERGQNQTISYEVDSTADKGFFRLHYTDQTATNLESADFDNDGLTNLQEITPYILPGTNAPRSIGGAPAPNSTQTNPLNGDTDGDGLSDKFERDNNLDGTDNGSRNPNNGPNGDPDGDGISNIDQQAAQNPPAGLTNSEGYGIETETTLTQKVNFSVNGFPELHYDSSGTYLSYPNPASDHIYGQRISTYIKKVSGSYGIQNLDYSKTWNTSYGAPGSRQDPITTESTTGSLTTVPKPPVPGVRYFNSGTATTDRQEIIKTATEYTYKITNNRPWRGERDNIVNGVKIGVIETGTGTEVTEETHTVKLAGKITDMPAAWRTASDRADTTNVVIKTGPGYYFPIIGTNPQSYPQSPPFLLDGNDTYKNIITSQQSAYGAGSGNPATKVQSIRWRWVHYTGPDEYNYSPPPATFRTKLLMKIDQFDSPQTRDSPFVPGITATKSVEMIELQGGVTGWQNLDINLTKLNINEPLDLSTAAYRDTRFTQIRANLLPMEVISDLNNDGQITAADNPLRDAAAASGATDEIKDKGTEFIFHNDTLSNGIWDKEDTDPAKPATAKDDDDAEEIRVKPGITEGEVWLEHPVIAGLSFYKTRECKAADKVNLSPTSKFTVSASNPFPDTLYMRADVDLAYPPANPQFEGDLVLKIKVGTAGQEIEATKMKLTVAKQLGAKKYFHAVRDYIFENNTKTFTQEKAYGASTKYRIVGMREESTFMSGLDTYDHAADAPRLRGIDEVKANYTSDVIINGNQCFFHDDRNPYIAGLTAQMTNRCEGRLCVARNILRPPSNDTHNPNLGGPGARYVGYTGGEPQIINGQVTVPSEFNFSTGQIPEAVPATPDHGIGGLAAKYDRQELQDSENQAIGRGPAIEQGKGIIFTATTYVGNPGNAKDFAADARKSGVKPLSGGDGSQWELLFLDGSSSVGLILTNPQGVQKTVIKGGKHTGAPYYYINTYLLFECQKVRN